MSDLFFCICLKGASEFPDGLFWIFSSVLFVLLFQYVNHTFLADYHHYPTRKLYHDHEPIPNVHFYAAFLIESRSVDRSFEVRVEAALYLVSPPNFHHVPQNSFH